MLSLEETIKEYEDKVKYYEDKNYNGLAAANRQTLDYLKELKARREADKKANAEYRELLQEIRN